MEPRRLAIPLVIAVTGFFAPACDRPAAESASTPKATSSASSRDPSAATSTALCRRIEADRAYELARAANGDVTVMKNRPRFREHREVAERAKKVGALSAQPVLVREVAVFSKAGMIERVAYGLSEDGLKRMGPSLATGRVPASGEANEVTLSTDDARLLGVRVGDRVTLSLPSTRPDYVPPSFVDGPPRPQHVQATLVGVYDPAQALGSPSSVWMDRERLDAIHPDFAVTFSADDASLLAIHLEDGADVGLFAAALTKALTASAGGASSLYKVFTHDELQKDGLKNRAELKTICGKALPPPATPKPAPMKLLNCTSDTGVLTDLTRLTHAIYGPLTVSGKPRPASALEKTSFPAASTSRRDAIVAYDGILFNDAATISAGALGLTRLSSLTPHVVRGDLAQVRATGGVALPRIFAERLGVDVGQTVQLAVRPPQRDPTAERAPLRTTAVDVAALVEFPHAGLNDHLQSVFMDRDYATTLHDDVKAGHANVLLLWPLGENEDALAEALDAAAPEGMSVSRPMQGPLDRAKRSLELLDGYCKTRDRRRAR